MTLTPPLSFLPFWIPAFAGNSHHRQLLREWRIASERWYPDLIFGSDLKGWQQ